MWTSPAAVPTLSPSSRSVFPNDNTDESVIEHDKRQRERRQKRWLAASPTTTQCKTVTKTVWDSPCSSPESKVSNTEVSQAKIKSRPTNGQLKLSAASPKGQKTVSKSLSMPREVYSPGIKPKTKKKVQSKRRLPLKEQQWMPIRNRPEKNKRTPVRVQAKTQKLKIKTQLLRSTQKTKPLTTSPQKSSQSDVFARLARSNSRRTSHGAAVRRVYSKKSPTVKSPVKSWQQSRKKKTTSPVEKEIIHVPAVKETTDVPVATQISNVDREVQSIQEKVETTVASNFANLQETMGMLRATATGFKTLFQERKPSPRREPRNARRPGRASSLRAAGHTLKKQNQYQRRIRNRAMGFKGSVTKSRRIRVASRTVYQPPATRSPVARRRRLTPTKFRQWRADLKRSLSASRSKAPRGTLFITYD